MKMGLLKKTFILLLAFTLVFDLLLIASINTVNSTFLNPDFIDRKLEDIGFYSRIQDSIAESVGNPEIEDALRKAVPESWIRENIQRILRNTFSYLNSETDSIDLKISLVEVKEKLLDELSNPTIAVGSFRIELDKHIPDSVDLSEELNDGGSGFITQLRAFIGFIRLLYGIIVLAALGLVLLIVVVSRDLKEISIALSFSSLAAGLLAYGTPMIASTLLFDRIKRMDLPSFLPAESLIKVLEEGMQPMKEQGMILFSAGIILSASYILLKTLEVKKEAEEEEETEQLLLEEIYGEN